MNLKSEIYFHLSNTTIPFSLQYFLFKKLKKCGNEVLKTVS